MEFNSLISWVFFLFCLGLAAGGTLIVFRRSYYRQHLSMRYLQYYLILIYTFGFYALWSQLLLRSLFVAIINPDHLPSLLRFLIMISVPFLLAAKIMLIFWAVHVLTFRKHIVMFPVLIIVCVAVAVGYVGYDAPFTVYRVYGGFVLLLMTSIATLLLFGKVNYLGEKPRLILSGLIFCIGLIHTPLYLGFWQVPLVELVFILLYFLGHSAFVVFFAYKVELPKPEIPQIPSIVTQETPPFELFITTYGITPREGEIIQEIYRGKTNQEIADQLFVTVQTIKDHTHRIYQKTDVKSRTQLASLMRYYQRKG